MRRIVTWLVVVVIVALQAGCVVVPARRAYYYDYGPYWGYHYYGDRYHDRGWDRGRHWDNRYRR